MSLCVCVYVVNACTCVCVCRERENERARNSAREKARQWGERERDICNKTFPFVNNRFLINEQTLGCIAATSADQVSNENELSLH